MDQNQNDNIKTKQENVELQKDNTDCFNDNTYHSTRFEPVKARDILWHTLCQEVFNKQIQPDFCTLDLGSGYGHFINNVNCREKIAIDSWPGLKDCVNKDVITHIGSVTNLDFLKNHSVDFAFASNLFEHCSQQDLTLVLEQLKTKLTKDGTLTILQPNYYYAYREYFDDYTHVSVYSHISIRDFLLAHEYEIVELKPRFLPLTVKSKLPVKPWLIKAYLACPFKPMGKQMLVKAKVKR